MISDATNLSDIELDAMAVEWSESYAQPVSREDVRAALAHMEAAEQKKRRAQWAYQISPYNPWLQDGSPLPIMSTKTTEPFRLPERQAIRDALLAAKGFVQWPAGSAAQRRVLDLIEKALKEVPHAE